MTYIDGIPYVWVGDVLVAFRVVMNNVGIRIDQDSSFVYALRGSTWPK